MDARSSEEKRRMNNKFASLIYCFRARSRTLGLSSALMRKKFIDEKFLPRGERATPQIIKIYYRAHERKREARTELTIDDIKSD